jgi:tRNA nucleotidyltransferase/poly(A) polymerase
MTYNEFLQNHIGEFLKIRSFASKVKYANQYLTRIGSGTGRIVYDIDGQKVLKLAKNPKGIAQNETEAGAGYYRDTHNIVAIVYESADDDSWLIAEEAKKVNENRIKQITGIPSLNELSMYVKNFNSSNHGRGNIFHQDPEIIEQLNENEFAQELTEFIANYGQQPGDYGRPSTFGEVLRDGQPTIVLTDYGLNDEVYNTHYAPKKEKYRMYELFDAGDGNDDILSDIGNTDEIRYGMWGLMPYSVSDGDGVINEDFISFVLNRDKYPTRPLPSMPYVIDLFHECVGNITEVMKNVTDKKHFYDNLLTLQEYLISQMAYDREPLEKEEYLIREAEIPNVKSDSAGTQEYGQYLANELASKLNLPQPKYLDSGSNGHAFELDENVVLKITSNISEADSAFKILRHGPPTYLATMYKIYKIIDTENNLAFFAIFQENIQDKPKDKFEKIIDVINVIQPNGIDFVRYIKILRKTAGNYVQINEYIKQILSANPEANKNETERKEAYDFLTGLVKIQDELFRYGVKSDDYSNTSNLGYKDGVLKFFDIGDIFGKIEPNVPSQDVINLPEDGSSRYSTYNQIQQDDFPAYNQNDTSPSIENNPHANDAILGEDLEYHHVVGSADEDEYALDEAGTKAWMPGAQTVTVKKKCRLGGLGNTSAACNQGDINNLDLKPIKEEIDPKEVAKDDNKAIKTVINGKRDVGFVELHKGNIRGIQKYNIGVLPVRVTPKNTIMAVIYRDKEKGEKLYQFARSHGGYLTDSTPEEAREIGKLLGYMDASIEEYVRRKYGSKIPVMPEKSPDDYDDLAEQMDVDVEKQIAKDITTHQLNKKLIRKEDDVKIMAINGDAAKDSGFIKFVDGGHHYVDAKDPENEQQYAKNIPEDEIWIDDVFLAKPNDMEGDILHEKLERYLMKFFGFSYDKAHEIANAAETIFRQKVKEGIGHSVSNALFNIFVNKFTKRNVNIDEAQIMSLQNLPFKEEIEQLGGKIYSVGGAVRDEFLGMESKDLDVLITGIPMDELEQVLSKYGKVDAVGKSFGVLKFKSEDAVEQIDIAIPRTEKPTGAGGHQGFDVTSDHALPIEKDLERRDFTINAVARDIEGNLVDPFGGTEDIKNKIIRVVNPEAFSDDPLRMLRAVQFASRFDFTIEPETMKMIQGTAERIKEIPPERILTEFDKIVKKGDKLTGAYLLKQTGLLRQIFGRDAGLLMGKNIWENTRTMGEFIWLLSHNLVENPAEFYKNNLKGDIDTYKEIKALDMAFNSGEATNLIEARAVASNMYITSPQSLQSQIIPDVIKTAAQELLQGKYPKTVNELAINGNDLMQLGLKDREIGDMQKSLLLKVYANNVRNNREELLNLAGQNRNMIKEEVSEHLEYGCLMLFFNIPKWNKITSVILPEDLYEKDGEYGIEKEPHLSILYGFHDEVTAEDAFNLFKENMPIKPIDIHINGISIFKNPEFDVVKFDVDSPELTRLNGIMRQLPNTSKFPDYHAHITIAYVKSGEGEKYIKPFEKERTLRGDELVFTWKGHRGKEGGEILKLSSVNEYAYQSQLPSIEPKSTWEINGQEVDVNFFVDKYYEWNQGEYDTASKESVLEFFQNNYEDLSHDEKLKYQVLHKLIDNEVLDEGVLNEMSIHSIDYDNIITPEYIKELETSDNYERYVEYYQYEHNLVDVEKEEIEKTEDFKNWLTYELRARFDDAVDNIKDKIKPDGTIDIWRRIKVDDIWVNHLIQAGKHLGIYWSWDERAAEAHWGDTAKNSNALIKSSIKEQYIDWNNTIDANMNLVLGEDEKEITLFKNTSLKIEELYIDGQDVEDVMGSDYELQLKNKIFYA